MDILKPYIQSNTKQSNTSMSYRTLALAASALLVLALADFPYGYYTFLRLVVCATAAFGAFKATSINAEGWTLILGGMAVLFNPIIPVHLDRDIWALLDLLAAGLLAVSAFLLSRRDEASREAA